MAASKDTYHSSEKASGPVRSLIEYITVKDSHPIDEVSQDLSPKKKDQSADSIPPLEISSFFLSHKEKEAFSPQPLIKSKELINLSKMAFIAPSENLIKGGGGWVRGGGVVEMALSVQSKTALALANQTAYDMLDQSGGK